MHLSLSLTSFTVGYACFVKLFTAANMPFCSISSHAASKWCCSSLCSELCTCRFNCPYWSEFREQLRFSLIRASVSWVIHACLGCVCISHSTFLRRTQVSTPSGTIIIVWCPIAIRFHSLQVQLEAGTCYRAPADTDRSATLLEVVSCTTLGFFIKFSLSWNFSFTNTWLVSALEMGRSLADAELWPKNETFGVICGFAFAAFCARLALTKVNKVNILTISY